MKLTGNKILIFSVFYLGARGLGVLVGLLTIPLALAHLGKELYGLWLLISSVMGWASLADLGLANGLTLALASGGGNRSLGAAVKGGVVVALLGIPVVWGVGSLIGWEVARHCFWICGVLFFLTFPFSLIQQVYVGYGKGYGMSGILALHAVCAVVVMVVCRAYDWGIIGWTAGLSVVPLVCFLVAWGFLPKVLPGVKVVGVGWEDVKSLLRGSRGLFGLQILSFAFPQTLLLIVGAWGSLSLVADYSVTWRLYLLILSLGTGIATPLYPAIRAAAVKGESTREAIRGQMVLQGIILIVPLGLILGWGEELFGWGIEYVFEKRWSLWDRAIFVAAAMMGLYQAILSQSLMAVGRKAGVVRVSLESGLLLVALGAISLRLFGIGGVYLAVFLSRLYGVGRLGWRVVGTGDGIEGGGRLGDRGKVLDNIDF